MLVQGEEEGTVIALALRGDHELNELKAEKQDELIRFLEKHVSFDDIVSFLKILIVAEGEACKRGIADKKVEATKKAKNTP